VTEWISSELRADHDLASFDCGKETLNKWLQEQSHRAQEADTARTYVWTQESSNVVRAYYSIAPTQVARQELTRTQSGGYSVIPAYLIAKLAIDISLRGKGLGAELLFDAIDKVVRAEAAGGGRRAADRRGCSGRRSGELLSAPRLQTGQEQSTTPDHDHGYGSDGPWRRDGNGSRRPSLAVDLDCLQFAWGPNDSRRSLDCGT
jgi:hypothetical protein